MRTAGLWRHGRRLWLRGGAFVWWGFRCATGIGRFRPGKRPAPSRSSILPEKAEKRWIGWCTRFCRHGAAREAPLRVIPSADSLLCGPFTSAVVFGGGQLLRLAVVSGLDGLSGVGCRAGGQPGIFEPRRAGSTVEKQDDGPCGRCDTRDGGVLCRQWRGARRDACLASRGSLCRSGGTFGRGDSLAGSL